MSSALLLVTLHSLPHGGAPLQQLQPIRSSGREEEGGRSTRLAIPNHARQPPAPRLSRGFITIRVHPWSPPRPESVGRVGPSEPELRVARGAPATRVVTEGLGGPASSDGRSRYLFGANLGPK